MTAVAGISSAYRIQPQRLPIPYTNKPSQAQPQNTALPAASLTKGLWFGALHSDGQVDPTLFIPKGTKLYLSSIRRENHTPQGTDLGRIEPLFQPLLKRVYDDVNGIYTGNLKSSMLLKGLVFGEFSTPKSRYLASLAIANGGPYKQTARLFRWYINEIESLAQASKTPLYSDLIGLRVITNTVNAWPTPLRKAFIKELLLRPDTLVGNELKQRLLIPASRPKETTGSAGPFRLNGITVAKPAKFEPADATPFENTFCYLDQRMILAKWLKQSMDNPPEPISQCRNDVSPTPGKAIMYNAPQLHEAITRFAMRHEGQGREAQHHKTLAWFADHLLTYDTQRLLANKLGIPNARFIDSSDGRFPDAIKTRWEGAWAIQMAIAFNGIRDGKLQTRLLDTLIAHQATDSPTAGIARQVVQLVTKDKTPVEQLVLELERLEKAS